MTARPTTARLRKHHGLGVHRDIKQARAFYSQACDKGLQPACDNLHKLP